jgi:hypothetical protein
MEHSLEVPPSSVNRNAHLYLAAMGLAVALSFLVLALTV